MNSIRMSLLRAIALGLVGAAFAACTIESTSTLAPYQMPAATPPYAPPTPEKQTRRVVILHTNDEHSHLLGVGPAQDYPYLPTFTGTFTAGAWSVDKAQTRIDIGNRLAAGLDTKTRGGIARRQYLINRERDAAEVAGNPVLLLSAGDVMMGSLFHVAYASGQAPDYLAMSFLGYDFATLGNHEFDFGADVLATAIEAAERMTFGGAVPLVISNMHLDDVVPGGPGMGLFGLLGPGGGGAPISAWATKTLPNGLKVGFMGLLGYDAALDAAGKGPISFSTPRDGAACSTGTPCAAPTSCIRGHCVNPLDAPGHRKALADDAQPMIDMLRNVEHVDLVVAITHLGIDEDQELVADTHGIDVIIGGHSHSLIEPTKVNDTIIVQAGDSGKYLGKLVVTVAPDGKVGYDTAVSSPIVVDYTVDAALRADPAAVDRAALLTENLMGALIGGLNEQLIGPLVDGFLAPGMTTPVASMIAPVPDIGGLHDVLGEKASQETYLAQLATDAVLDRITNHSCFGFLDPLEPPVVAVQANGVLRDSLHFSPLDHKTTVGDIFDVLPLGGSPWARKMTTPGYPLLYFKLNAREVLQGLDVGVTRGLTSDAFFLTYAGIKTEYDPSRPAFDPNATDPYTTGRIVKITVVPEGAAAYDLYDTNAPDRWKDKDGAPFDPESFYVAIATNLYLAGYLDAFGLSPRDDSGDLISGATMLDRLQPTAVCYGPGALVSQNYGCLPLPAVGMCASETVPPLDGLPQMKEWEALFLYLLEKFPPSTPIGSAQYLGDGVSVTDQRISKVP